MKLKTHAALAAVAVACLAAAGCGGDTAADTTAATPAASTQAAAPATTEQAAATTEQAAPAAETGKGAKVTPLGTTLAIGDAAVIDYEDASTKATSTIELTPEAIEKGTLEDFRNIQLDENQKTATPYYAKVKVTNTGDGDLGGTDPASYINGVDDRGQDQNELIFIGDFARCDYERPKKLGPGDGYEACLVYLIPKGGSLKGFHWIQFDEQSGKSDLVWK